MVIQSILSFTPHSTLFKHVLSYLFVTFTNRGMHRLLIVAALMCAAVNIIASLSGIFLRPVEKSNEHRYCQDVLLKKIFTLSQLFHHIVGMQNWATVFFLSHYLYFWTIRRKSLHIWCVFDPCVFVDFTTRVSCIAPFLFAVSYVSRNAIL